MLSACAERDEWLASEMATLKAVMNAPAQIDAARRDAEAPRNARLQAAGVDWIVANREHPGRALVGWRWVFADANTLYRVEMRFLLDAHCDGSRLYLKRIERIRDGKTTRSEVELSGS